MTAPEKRRIPEMGSSVVFWVFCLWVAVCEENGRTSRSPRFFEFRYEFTTAKTVLKEANNAFFRTAFCLSVIFFKTYFLGRQTYVEVCIWGAQSA